MPPPPYSGKGFGLKRKAFTLAETLITLTIIGVIAAITVPTLLSKYQKHTYVVGLKKAYSELSNAVKMIPISEGCPAGDYECAGVDISFFEESDDIRKKTIDIIAKQFKIEKVCYRNTDPSCEWLDNLEQDATGLISDIAAGFITLDGLAFGFHAIYDFHVDVNGLKGPNKEGRDQFRLHIDYGNATVKPHGSWGSNEQLKEWCKSERLSDSCAARVLREDAMNY